MNYTEGCSFWLDCKDLLCVFETSVMRDHGSNCDSVTTGRVGLEQATRPLSASFRPCKTWRTIPHHLHQRVDMKLK